MALKGKGSERKTNITQIDERTKDLRSVLGKEGAVWGPRRWRLGKMRCFLLQKCIRGHLFWKPFVCIRKQASIGLRLKASGSNER